MLRVCVSGALACAFLDIECVLYISMFFFLLACALFDMEFVLYILSLPAYPLPPSLSPANRPSSPPQHILGRPGTGPKNRLLASGGGGVSVRDFGSFGSKIAAETLSNFSNTSPAAVAAGMEAGGAGGGGGEVGSIGQRFGTSRASGVGPLSGLLSGVSISGKGVGPGVPGLLGVPKIGG